MSDLDASLPPPPPALRNPQAVVMSGWALSGAADAR